MTINIKRVYDPCGPDDGFRVLVDRLWPRGIKKDQARVDLWAKDVAPSAELRQWFGHVPDRFVEFADRYEAELRGGDALARLLAALAPHDVVTLLYAAKDASHNNAVVLARVLAGM